MRPGGKIAREQRLPRSSSYLSDGGIRIRIVTAPAKRLQRVRVGFLSDDAPTAAGGRAFPNTGLRIASAKLGVYSKIGENAKLKDGADKALPTLQHHLEMLRQ